VEHSRIYLIGFMGAGKSTVGRRLAKKLRWKFIDLDEEIERHEHRPIAEIFREHGEPHFRNLESLCLHRVSSSPKAVIALGGGTFIDPGNRDLAEKTGLTVWLKVSFAKLAARVKIDGTRPKFSDKDQAERLYQTREPFYALAKVHIATDDGTAESVADEIMGVLNNS
jgi:shikimate kinase